MATPPTIPILSHEMVLPPVTRFEPVIDPHTVKYLKQLNEALRARERDTSNALSNILTGNVSFTGGGWTTTVSAFTPAAVAIPTGFQIQLLSSGTAADQIAQLPAAVGTLDQKIIKKTDANAFNIDVTPYGTDTINGATGPMNITIQYDGLWLMDFAPGQWITLP